MGGERPAVKTHSHTCQGVPEVRGLAKETAGLLGTAFTTASQCGWIPLIVGVCQATKGGQIPVCLILRKK